MSERRRSGGRPAKPRLLVTRRLPPPVEAALHDRFRVTQREDDTPLDEAEVAEGMRTHDAILCTLTDRIGVPCFASEGRTARIVANFGVGVNHIAMAAAREAGVVVTNTPDV